jgi:hypothetical protein
MRRNTAPVVGSGEAELARKARRKSRTLQFARARLVEDLN